MVLEVYNLRRTAVSRGKPIWACDILGLQKVKESRFSWHLAAQAKKKAAHGHMVYAVQEVPFWAPFDAVFDTSCPGNERCAVVASPRPAMAHQDRQLAVPAFSRVPSMEVPLITMLCSHGSGQ